MAASLGGYVQVVQALLHHGERGADPLQANESGKTALGLAVHSLYAPSWDTLQKPVLHRALHKKLSTHAEKNIVVGNVKKSLNIVPG